MRRVLGLTCLVGVAASLSACGYVSKYERQVYDWQPVYCYKTLAAVECQRTPDRTRDAVMVNYYGPSPTRTDPPKQPEGTPSAPPPDTHYWVKDPEPVPTPSPTGDLSDRPWLKQKDHPARLIDETATPPAPAPATATRAAPAAPQTSSKIQTDPQAVPQPDTTTDTQTVPGRTSAADPASEGPMATPVATI